VKSCCPKIKSISKIVRANMSLVSTVGDIARSRDVLAREVGLNEL